MLCSLGFGAAEAQQIYRWTDAQGKAHFGNVPPPDAQQVETKGRAKTEAEHDCEAAADRQCRRDMQVLNSAFHDMVPTTAIRDCLAEYTANCARRSERRADQTGAARHALVTPRIRFDPTAGDRLACRMRCTTKCSGSIEILDLDSLARGENRGALEHAVFYVPTAGGSAYCRATTAATDATVELTLARGATVLARATAP
jgi:Domain of unknown function (DUF4124)